jgi:hypothetical protein
METATGVLRTRRARSRRIGKGSVAMVLATAMLVGGTYVWQHVQVHDRQVALDRAISAADAAHSQASALGGQVVGLQGQIETLQRNAETLTGSKQHTAAQLRRAEARMKGLLGSPLADGRYFGAVVVVGANQTPPRLVIDLERWLTGDAAQQAAIEYGVPPGDVYENFIENDSPAWRTVEIAPTATVSILGPGNVTRQVGTGTVGIQPISLGKFAKMMSLGHFYNPFWITVSNGRISAIDEEYLA